MLIEEKPDEAPPKDPVTEPIAPQNNNGNNQTGGTNSGVGLTPAQQTTGSNNNPNTETRESEESGMVEEFI